MSHSRIRKFCFAAILFAVVASAAAPAVAAFFRRQYYSTWSYHPTTRYHYCRYYYTPTIATPTYHHHYVIYYPSRPRYRYYYNPVRRLYWGRFEVDEAGKPMGYSMLKPEDRKSSLEAIAESAFPKPSEMPSIPESEEAGAESIEKMLPPPDVVFAVEHDVKDS
ncbi:hypothetical protein [Rubripirellula tenax]|nr:hypothetical protein [Rubripirellula tenax]